MSRIDNILDAVETAVRTAVTLGAGDRGFERVRRPEQQLKGEELPHVSISAHVEERELLEDWRQRVVTNSFLLFLVDRTDTDEEFWIQAEAIVNVLDGADSDLVLAANDIDSINVSAVPMLDTVEQTGLRVTVMQIETVRTYL